MPAPAKKYECLLPLHPRGRKIGQEIRVVLRGQLLSQTVNQCYQSVLIGTSNKKIIIIRRSHPMRSLRSVCASRGALGPAIDFAWPLCRLPECRSIKAPRAVTGKKENVQHLYGLGRG